MKCDFHPDAELELNEAANYYEECQKGLGLEFLKQVMQGVERILFFPSAWSLFGGRFRRVLVNRFPYGIVYFADVNAHIVIVAVMHLKRKPNYWLTRVEK